MDLRVRNGELVAILQKKYSSVKDLKKELMKKLGVESVDENGEGFYMLFDGKLLAQNEQLQGLVVAAETGAPQPVVTIVPRVLGGKGGFGSMLRAIGAQIEKTTNRDACRDLSGRRLRDINEEKRLKMWYSKMREREDARKAKYKEKIAALKKVAEGPPLPKIEDQEFLKKREDIEANVFEAVDQGFSTIDWDRPFSEEEETDEDDVVDENESDDEGPFSHAALFRRFYYEYEAEKKAKADAEKAAKAKAAASGSNDEPQPGPSGAPKPVASSSKVTKKPTKEKSVKKTMFDEDLDSDDSDSETETGKDNQEEEKKDDKKDADEEKEKEDGPPAKKQKI